MTIVIKDSIVTAYVGEEEIVTYFDPQHQKVVQIGLGIYYERGGTERTMFDNFRIEEIVVDP